jgi:hypothetical protein
MSPDARRGDATTAGMALTVWTAVIRTSGCLASNSVLASMRVSSPVPVVGCSQSCWSGTRKDARIHADFVS